MAKKYKCPYCQDRLIRKDLIDHIDKEHEELIPDGSESAQVVYDVVNNTNGAGRCRVCGRPTKWNSSSKRYDVLCENPRCKQRMREEYQKNMLKVHGTYNILNDDEQQKKMLANRSISGTYKFITDGGFATYTGSYEKKFLEFADKVMGIPSKDIMAPGPTLEYEMNGEKHFYITDFLYIPYNLIIEVKDGGANPNNKNSEGMKSSRQRTIEKEKLITDRGEFNYLRLTDNQFVQLLEIFMEIKKALIEGDDKPVIRINESADDKYRDKIKELQDKYGVVIYSRKSVDIDGSDYLKFLPTDIIRNEYDVESIINENTYVVSDLHFGKDKSEDNKTIRFLNKIPNSANLLILGDIGYNKEPDVNYLEDCFSRIKCRNMFLILGNHDCLSLDIYYGLGIKGVYEKIFKADKKWVFSHYPCDGPDISWINFHGHIHDETVYTRVKDTTNKINCYYKYFSKPLKIKELLEWNRTNNIEKIIVDESYINESYLSDLIKINMFNKKLNMMEYILVTKDKKIITKIKEDDFDKYESLTPDEFIKYNGGICWDYVAYEAKYFSDNFKDVKYKTYYICFNNKHTHTVLLFNIGNNWYWFESSIKRLTDVQKFNSENEALIYIRDKLIEFLDEDIRNDFIVEYNALDSRLYNISCDEYMNYMKNQKHIKHESYINEAETDKPKKCNKCASENIGVYLKGEPIYQCADCGKYLGVVPFPSKKEATSIFPAGYFDEYKEDGERRLKEIQDEERKNNLIKLDQIASLEDNWNENGAKSFDEALIGKARLIINSLMIQPELFPVASNSLQLEYQKKDGSYLEFHINSNNTCDVFKVNNIGEESEFTIVAESDNINKIVNNFYSIYESKANYNLNLTKFNAYHLEPKLKPRSKIYPTWDEELYSKTIESAIQNDIRYRYELKGFRKVSAYVYTADKDLRAVYLGIITIPDKDNPNDWEWEEQEVLDRKTYDHLINNPIEEATDISNFYEEDFED